MPKSYATQSVVPELLPRHIAAFTTWYEGRFGVRLEPAEATARLSHLAHLFLLLDGASWIEGQKKRIKKL